MRRAFYVDSRCISIVSEVLEIARECGQVDDGALGEALASGWARARVFADFELARGESLKGSPDVFLSDGMNVHNPGIEEAWTGRGGEGYPVIVSDHPAVWVDLVRRAMRTCRLMR